MRKYWWIAFLAAFGVYAQQKPLTLTDVSRSRDALARAKDLTETDRNEISGYYDQAAKQLQQQIRWQAQAVGNARTKSVIENELAAARAAATITPPGPPPPPPSETTEQVMDELARVRTDRASLIRRREELSKLLTSLVTRGQAITTRRAEIRESLQSIDDEISVLTLASATPQWEQAKRTELQARKQSLEQELQTVGTERDTLDLRRQLIPLQREAYLLKQEAADQLLDQLKIRQVKARTRDAQSSLNNAVSEAQRHSAGYSQLSKIAEEIKRYATKLWSPDGIEAKSDQAAAQSEEMKVTLASVKEITATTLRRYQNSGFLSSASEWLPARVERLGNPVHVGVRAVGYSAAEVVARREVLKLEEERNLAPALETQVQALVAASGKKPGDKDFEDFKSRARSLFQLKRNVMSEYLNSGRTLVIRLGEAHTVAMDLLRSMQELQSFIFQRVLWARSVPGSQFPSGSDFLDAVRWFFSPASWSRIIAGFTQAGVRSLLWITWLLAILALFIFRQRLRKRLNSSRLSTPKSGRMRGLLSSLLLGILAALPGPLVIAYLGWMIGQAGEEVDMGRAIAAGASQLARYVFGGILLRMILSDGGATDRLMGWSREVRGSLDLSVKRLMLVFAPLYAVAAALASEGMFFSGDEALQSHHNSLGRLCFIAAILSLLLTGRQLLKPNGPVTNALGHHFGTGLDRARVLRATFFLFCLVVIALAFLGFYITAYVLVVNVIRTVGLTLVLVLLSAMMSQWRLDQQEKVAVSKSPQDEEKARTADMQVRRLSHFGLTLVWIAGGFAIWSTTLPALSLLNQVELLPELRIVDRTSAPETQNAAQATPKSEKEAAAPAKATAMLPLPSAPKQAQAVQPRKPLYLTDVFWAIFVGVLTSMLVSNIPGLLQFTVFRRLKFDEGGQYAVNTIARYIAIFIGTMAVSLILGVNWTSIQWLAAALTFGIGFGLQEIFANFASGLILLLDRSIRVGDVVTVGTLSGVVARIQMRATTVTLWDRSDMVVPNKEFITAKLVNWTLSNPETRVDLKVGVDYGSDVEQVREVLMRLAQEHPAVLKHPEPQVLLTEFGESAILFELRVFGLYSYGRPVLLDELHRAVVREFKKLGIVIAFPHLEVNLNPALPPAKQPDGV